eukprot:TRINITY_DN916_c0_g1_i1.p1 TRINITY_DN916_c0_g1~~TRINITY_DN916_c0_g1_i1.p1  ORF type:complete len:104 (+),score=43.49 TRINITY_DN916_c0_g1_i1:127-438(+)
MLALLAKYPDRVPVKLTRYAKSNLPNLDKAQQLYSRGDYLSSVICKLKKSLQIQEKEKTLYLFINDRTPPDNSKTLGELYDTHKSADLLLHLTYAEQNSFGSL